jgi:uncharacterized coiled-coil protein SlyX
MPVVTCRQSSWLANVLCPRCAPCRRGGDRWHTVDRSYPAKVNADEVEAVTRWVGVTITLVGAFIVSPAGTVALLGRWRGQTVEALRHAEDAVRRLVRRPRTLRITGQSGIASAFGTGTGTLTVTGTAIGYAPDLSVEGRLDRLEQRAADAEARITKVSTQAAAERAQLIEELGNVAEEQRAGTAELHARLDHAERQAVEVDAAALPVVALGVLVSGLSPDAHRLPLVLWALLLVAAVTLTLRGVLGARTRRHADAPEAAAVP